MPERDCNTCTAHLKRQRGCETDAPMPMRLDGKDVFRCPRRPILDDPRFFDTVLTQYKAYIRGYLPDPGSLLDQGHRYVVSMAVVEGAIAEAEQEQERRERKKQT